METIKLKPELQQPLINIGTAGHVDHGKSTLVYALTGIWPAKHSEEQKRGITIKLGYANTTIMRCPVCKEPERWTTSALSPDGHCRYCGSILEPVRMVSFVDSPGHEMLMATMLSGAAVMDAALLVIDASMPCPQPQTKEHFKALEITGVKNIIVVQNKVEIVSRDEALKNYMQIKDFLRGTFAEDAPIIPVSALHKANLDLLIEAIQKFMPTPSRDESKDPIMHVIRSFDVNRPGTPVSELKGGVIGGSIVQGVLKVGDEIEILPGAKIKERGRIKYIPLHTRIVGLKSGEVELKIARPGGLIGISTELDPSLTKADSMASNVVGKPGRLPEPVYELTLEYELFDVVVGTAKPIKVERPRIGEDMAIHVGSARSLGKVTKVKKDVMELKLVLPIVPFRGGKVAISRRIFNRWRLIGHGVIK